MAWQNLFDAGPCDVYLSSADATHLYMGHLAKGGSATHHDSTSGRDYTVAIDSTGVVSVTSSFSGLSGSEVIAVSVVPSSNIVGAALRLRSLYLDWTANQSAGYADWASGGTYLPITIGPPASPDPLALVNATSGTMANGMGMRAIGLLG